MSEPILAGVEVLLCDADGNLFGSEEPAFAASTRVTNALLAHLGIAVVFAPDELRRAALGQNFRGTAVRLAAEHGVAIDDDALEHWVAAEREAVIAHLREVLRPDPAVTGPLQRLAGRHRLALVSSSALARLDACLDATDLGGLFAPEVRFSAEDSLPVPTSKPDPAVYRLAGERLGVGGGQALAVEDAVAGVRSAVGAGFPCVGNLQFTPAEEREERAAALRAAGAAWVVGSWDAVGLLLDGATT